jgi:YfaZ precursor
MEHDPLLLLTGNRPSSRGAIMILRTIATFFALMLMASTASFAQSDREHASALEVALSNDTLQLRYIAGGEMVGVEEGEFSGTFFLSEERDIVLSAALLFPISLGIDRLELKVGPQIYAALLDEENDDVMSATLGLEARYLLLSDLGLAISGQAFYGPDILTFGSADNLTDLSARVEIGVGERLLAFAGMRWFEFDLTDGSGTRTLQEEVFVGAQYRF